MATPKKSTSKRTQRPAGRRIGLGAAPGQYDVWLLVIVATLVGLGLVMVFSASFIQANRIWNQPTYYALRQLRWIVVGVAAMAGLAYFDYRWLRHVSLPLLAVTLLALIAVLIFGTETLGSKRHLLGTSVQPSELAKLAIVIYIAHWLSSKGSRIKAISDGLLPFAVLLGMVAVLIAAQPDMGTTALIVATALSMFFVAGANAKQTGIILSVASVTFVVMATRHTYASKRVTDYLDFLRDPTTGSDQLQFGLQAIARGGFFGVGLGSGQRLVQLPFTDSIFAFIGYELGLMGTLAVVFLFGVFAFLGLRIALRSTDTFGMLLGIGITAWLTMQAVLNMAVNLGVVPFSGLTLPFVSYGGSSLSICLACVGILLSISRFGTAHQPSPARTAVVVSPPGSGADYATLTVRWRHWRTRLSHFGRSRRARGGRTAPIRRSGTSRNAVGGGGYSVKSLSAPRTDGLSRRVTRAKRTIARKTGANKRKPAGNSRPGQRIPRRR